MPDARPTVQALRPCKHPLRSRTLIVNAIALALIAAEAQLGLLQQVLPVNVYALAAFVLPVVNAALRLATNTGVSLRHDPPPCDEAHEDA